MDQLKSSAATIPGARPVSAAAINVLPEEVLCDVFELSVVDLWDNIYLTFAEEAGPNKTELKLLRLQPFALAAVCRLWRAVTHAYAPLWRRVVLDPTAEVNVANAAAWASYIQLLNERSKQTPTDIVVYLSPIELLDPMQQSLARLVERVRSMLLIGPYQNLSYFNSLAFLTSFGGQYLESFVLRRQRLGWSLGGATGRYPRLPGFFPEVNKLHTLELDEVVIPWSKLDLASVREAKIVFSWRLPMTPDAWQTVFAAIPNVWTLFLTLGTIKLPEILGPSDLIQVHGVRDLVIRGSDERQAGLLRLPHVERVRLEYLDWAALAGHLSDSLGQSGAENLTTVTVLNSWLNAEVAHGLASIRTLKEFNIVECGIQSNFFPALGPGKCPNLREFTYRRLPELEKSGSEPGQPNVELEEHLFDFVSRRVEADNRLQIVRVPGWLKQWRTMSMEEMQSKIDLMLQR